MTEITPNVVISNPNTRKNIGVALYAVSLLAGLAALLFAFFPELAYGTDIPTRAIAFINGAVSLLSGGFGLIVTVPNVPQADQRTSDEREADEQAAASRAAMTVHQHIYPAPGMDAAEINRTAENRLRRDLKGE